MKLASLLLAIATVTAASAEFSTSSAKSAHQNYQMDVEDTRQAMDERLVAIRTQYLTALDEAAKSAVDEGDLDEVVRIKQAKETLSTEGVLLTDRPPREVWSERWPVRFSDGDIYAPGGSVSYDLPPNAIRFAATLYLKHPQGRVRFKVSADGKEIYSSKSIQGKHQADIRVELPRGSKEITLTTDKDGDGKYDHCGWLKPRLILR